MSTITSVSVQKSGVDDESGPSCVEAFSQPGDDDEDNVFLKQLHCSPVYHQLVTPNHDLSHSLWACKLQLCSTSVCVCWRLF